MESPKHLCQSCHCLVEENAKFCSICGQKKILKPLSFRELLGDFFSNLFSLDSKFFRTFGRLIFFPGNLTNEYVAGRRQFYYTPIRLFLFWLTIAFVLLNFVLSDVQEISKEIDEEMQIGTYKDSLRTQLDLVFMDSSSQQKIDSILPNNEISEALGNTFVSMNYGDSISMKDLYLLSSDEIIEKYEVEGFVKQQFVHQMIKAVKSPGHFQIYLLSHLSWIILFSIPFIALILKLLYIRRKKLYIEHFVYTLHLHTFLFICFSVLSALSLMTSLDFSLGVILLIVILISLYLILSLKNVYQQSLLKTSFKILLFLAAYPIIIIIALAIFFVINFFAF